MRADSRLIQMFVAVADALSFTRAAETLHVAQPWLSAQIRKLEQQLGFDLFIRDSRRVQLSDKGRRLLQPARDVTLSLEQFLAHVRRLQGEQQQAVLRIGLPPYSHLFPARVTLLEQFAQVDANVRIETVVSWSPELLEKVLAGSLDLAFVVGELNDAALQRLAISTGACRIYCRHDDPLAKLPRVQAAQLSGRQVLAFERALNPALFDQLFAAALHAGAVLQSDHEMMGERWLEQLLGGHAVGLNFVRTPPAHLLAQLCVRRYEDAADVGLYLIRRHGSSGGVSQAYWDTATAFAVGS
ncbi:LysR family transcriptional regulator [Stenotrophomonas sp. SY1]|uniref:LysR family transcriptional regulator n=1 Tax=Stenotrophomonas sp. SY1 TaxID=477235 RepID=UPI001E294A12|nr:LysR family transcriptional regulator [Stenotrophomonas sp. SY1]MCD9088295.1 LysR family transcriptional regulator [Stenotrophomonas sp. SY1]